MGMVDRIDDCMTPFGAGRDVARRNPARTPEDSSAAQVASAVALSRTE
jgi:hypothetical protein